MAEVFVSYSWDSDEHNKKVLSFTNHLREEGFEAQVDKMLSQNETSINFVKMMHLAMQGHEKVIVVLSVGYKQKAETFSGGVGEEYQLLLNDINSHPKKYILVSFVGRPQEIIPFGLIGRDIVDLSKAEEEDRLFRKLLDEKEFEFSPVGMQKPRVSPEQIPPFLPRAEMISIEIKNLSFKQGDASLSAGLYNHVEFIMGFDMKNISSKPIDNYSAEVTYCKFLDEKYFMKNTSGDEIISTQNYNERLFPGQTKRSTNYEIKISKNSLLKVLSSTIHVKIYTDMGVTEKEYPLKAVIKIRPGAYKYSEPVNISRELFSS